MNYKLPPRLIYNAGDRIRWMDKNTGEHFAGTVLEPGWHLPGEKGKPPADFFRTRIDTCIVHGENRCGEVVPVTIDQIEAAVKL